MNFFGLFYIADWLLLLLFFGFAVYESLAWRFNELRILGIPGPKPSVPLGNLLQIFKLGNMEADLVFKMRYGKIFGIYIGCDPAITIADLDIVRKIVIKDFEYFTDRRPRYMRGALAHGLFDTYGERWRTMRRKLTPAFTSGKLKLMMSIMKTCASAMVENLDDFAKSGEMFEARRITDSFTSDNIASTCFGIELNAQRAPDHPFLRHSKAVFQGSIHNIYIVLSFIMPRMIKWLERIKPSCLPKDSEEYFVNLLLEAIQVRKNNPSEKKDLIQIILDAEEDSKKLDDETKAVFNEGLGFSEKDESGGLSQEEVIANMFLFLLAGHETTSGTLSFLLYNLAIHPEVQERLSQEINTVVKNEELTYETMNKLSYMDKCMKESMRLYPLVPRLDRVCLQERQYGDLKIPKGYSVHIPIRSFHYDPEVWPEPEKFDPCRFDAEEKAKRDPLSFMPFGQGPRMCIGNRFALLTMKMALVYLLKNFTFHRCVKTEVPLTMRKVAVSLQPEHGIWLTVKHREI